MSSKVCGVINVIDNYLYNGPNNPGKYKFNPIFNAYCPNKQSDSNEQTLSCAFITLLALLKDIVDKENLGSDKLAEYAILWLSYKLNQKSHHNNNDLDNFFVQYINNNEKYSEEITDGSDYKSYNDLINKKKNLMSLDINIISSFYDTFKSLCNMYSEIDLEKKQCNKCFENGEEFFEKYEKLKKFSGINERGPYSQILSSLLDDYEKFENKYKSLKCSNISPLVACPRSSVTKNTLITIAIMFVAASILLGVSYKYSLFGFRKRPQKQHLRKKLKK
ncbi:PIR protein [Plasmodium yoelii]|uniref:PIR protein n=2 Tax=Plasmodium yoelii TaxID=5861 RepID=A0AAE9WMH0_PLAYO|nr:PIR protein [Plasmodium yoelii]WBY56485.1 PIR protein [Plasmodium yoelii yoelii]CDU17354.1 YIR protein [Plasmodium yoelii]VTZ76644.1 PIR protein [Plasmodium yoelii]|eukprot:XP_022811864.1 PIR protein [Plasmodium yoelii]